MVGKLRFKRPYLTIRLIVVFAVIAGVNIYGYTLWQEKLPWVSPFHNAVAENTPESSEEALVVPVDVSSPWVGQEVLDKLVRTLPSPNAGWVGESGAGNMLSTGTVIDTACPVEFTYMPTLQKQQSWRYAGEEGRVGSSRDSTLGVLAQVRIYKAGMGAVVFRNLEEQINTCSGEHPTWQVRSFVQGGNIGVESLTTVIDGAGGDQELTFFRYGDIIGVVAERGYAESSSVLAERWFSGWGRVLGDVCREPYSTVQDASRQPFSRDYTGFLETVPYRLPEGQRMKLEAEVTNAIYSGDIIFDIDGERFLPPAPLLSETAGMELELQDIPQTYLNISLPEQPDMPAYPKPLSKAPLEGTISGLAEDRFGPGCGWHLSGQAVPEYDKEESAKSWEKSQNEVFLSLSEKYRKWFFKSWQRAVDYEKYVRDVNRWNVWAEERLMLISTAEWEAYDEGVRVYEEILPQYEEALNSWTICIQESTYSSPLPQSPQVLTPETQEEAPVKTDDTTVIIPGDPSYTVEQCGEKPVMPVKPTEPAWPRPFIADPAVFNG